MADAPASGPSPQPRSAAFRCYIIIFLFDKCMSLYLARMCLQKKFIIILFHWLVAAGVQCQTRPDELPASAERRSGATNHYPLLERDNLEPRPLWASVPECSLVPGVDRRNAGAGCVSRHLLGERSFQKASNHPKHLSNLHLKIATAIFALCAKKIKKLLFLSRCMLKEHSTFFFLNRLIFQLLKS